MCIVIYLLAFFFRPTFTFQCTTSRHIELVRGFGGGIVGVAVLCVAVSCVAVLCLAALYSAALSLAVLLVVGYFLSISIPIPARLFIHYPIRYSCYKNTLVNNLEKIRIFFYQIYSYFVWGRGGDIFLYQIFLYR
ncbi:hypothetical protein BGX38DRAFT_1222410, partial [Terfezia claveryi]